LRIIYYTGNIRFIEATLRRPHLTAKGHIMSKLVSGSRRATDKVSTDESLELLATLAYEYALKNDAIDILSVENAILKVRQLKIEATGGFRTLNLDEVK